MSALAIAWVLHHPRVDAAIIGPRTAVHLAEAVTSTTITLSDDEARTLTALFETKASVRSADE
jgi:aryl-alcohol dehydrogenase-like predicted oxidoreductase